MAKKKANKTDISVIIPVHEITEGTEKLFANAITSVADQSVRPDEVLIVTPKDSDAHKYVADYDYKDLNVRIVENVGDTSFSSQLNLGVEECETTWFSLLEYDDEFSKIWIKNVVEYREHYGEMDMFLPIIVDVDENGAFIGLTNEAVWAAEFCDEMGVLDNTALLAYQNFNFDGMVMRKETYQDMGGLKESMKLTFIYEFLLRITYMSARIMVIPRFGYKHVNQRTGSLFHSYKDGESGNALTADEARWWMSLAKKEYFHPNDRKITYEEK